VSLLLELMSASLPVGWEDRHATLSEGQFADRASVSAKIQLSQIKSEEAEREDSARAKALALGTSVDPWAKRLNTLTAKELMSSDSASAIAVGEVLTKGEPVAPFLPPPPCAASGTHVGPAAPPALDPKLATFMQTVMSKLEAIDHKVSALGSRTEAMENQVLPYDHQHDQLKRHGTPVSGSSSLGAMLRLTTSLYVCLSLLVSLKPLHTHTDGSAPECADGHAKNEQVRNSAVEK